MLHVYVHTAQQWTRPHFCSFYSILQRLYHYRRVWIELGNTSTNETNYAVFWQLQMARSDSQWQLFFDAVFKLQLRTLRILEGSLTSEHSWTECVVSSEARHCLTIKNNLASGIHTYAHTYHRTEQNNNNNVALRQFCECATLDKSEMKWNRRKKEREEQSFEETDEHY